MTLNDALALCEELRQLAGDCPGARPEAIRRAEQIQFALGQGPRVNAYLREKIGEVVDDLGYWCTERRWRQFGNDPSNLHGNLMNNVAKLESAVRRAFNSECVASDKSR